MGNRCRLRQDQRCAGRCRHQPCRHCRGHRRRRWTLGLVARALVTTVVGAAARCRRLEGRQCRRHLWCDNRRRHRQHPLRQRRSRGHGARRGQHRRLRRDEAGQRPRGGIDRCGRTGRCTGQGRQGRHLALIRPAPALAVARARRLRWRAHGWRRGLRLGHHSHGRRGLGRRRHQLAPRCIGQRLARIGCELLPLRGKAGMGCRWRGAGHHLAPEAVLRRPGAGHGRAVHALRRGRHRGDCHDRCGGQCLARNGHHGPGHLLRLCKRGPGHCDHRAGHLPVGIHHLGHVGAVVVVVVDHRVVDHGVAAVDVLEIPVAHRVRRPVDLARRQRKPGYATDVAARDGQLEVVAADEGHQCRRIVGTGPHRPWHPEPVARAVGPATVVRHSVAPGRVVDPGPAPGVDPGPVAVAVRHPARRHPARYPYVAVARLGPPDAIAVEVLVADHFGRDIARGGRAFQHPVAACGPAVQVVQVRRLHQLVVAQAGASEAVGLARVDQIGCALAIGLALALAHDDVGAVGCRVGADPVLARLAQGEGQVGCVDFDHLVWRHAAHPHDQAALA